MKDKMLGKLAVGILFGVIITIGVFLLTYNILLSLLSLITTFLIIFEFKKDPFLPVFLYLVKFLIFYVLAAVVYFSIYSDKYNIYSLASFYLLLSLIFFYTGYKSNIGRFIGYKIPYFNLNLNSERATIAIILSFSLGLISLMLIFYLNGGFLNFITYLANRSRLIQGIGPLRVMVDYIGLSAIIGFVGIHTCYRRSYKAKVFVYLLIAMWLLVTIILGGRGYFLWQIFTFLFIYHFLGKKIKFRTIFPIAIVLIIFLFVSAEIRANMYAILGKGQYERIGENIINLKEPAYIVKRNFPFFDVFSSIVETVPAYYPFYYGKTYLQTLTAIIPRALWPNKPFGVASEVAYLLYGLRFYHSRDLTDFQTGPAVRLIDEAYLNFSFPGIILAFFLYGIIMKVFTVYLYFNHKDTNVVLICSLFFPFVIYHLDGNSFMNMIRLFGYSSMIIFLLITLKGKLVKR